MATLATLGHSRILAALAGLLLTAAAAAGSDKEKDQEREEEERRAEGKARAPAKDDDLLYALGALLGHRVEGLHLKAAELAQVRKGFAAAAAGEKLKLPSDELEEWGPRVDHYLAKRMAPLLSAEKERGKAFLDQLAKEPGAARTASGLVHRVLVAGSGASPAAGDKVRVQYQGKLIDGTVFDDSNRHGGTTEVALGSVIGCWSEGLQRMKVGEKARLACPASLGYGDQGRPPQVPGGAALVFEVELIGISGR